MKYLWPLFPGKVGHNDRQEARQGGLLVTCAERVVILWEAAATMFP